MPGSQLKEKMFKCFIGQGHKNKENRETHTKQEQAFSQTLKTGHPEGMFPIKL